MMKQKTSYHRLTDQVIEEIKESNRRPSLLLHCCCAPCATVPLVDWSPWFDITAYYYNPNIFPAEEADMRCRELERFIGQYPFEHAPKILIGAYEPERFYEAARGYESEPERGERCSLCFFLRLNDTARLAKEMGFDYFTTTLSISPHKDAHVLHHIGLQMEKCHGVQYLPCDLKKNDGMKRSVTLAKAYDLYRQAYCGCVYSRDQKRLKADIDAKGMESQE